ncbi:MAG: LssY C-terminal domain-containing protein [Acidobacteriaceae bacterium]|nr:LssY C-terminal domain-containing protein [Acidobacteriaceae bacterium]
MRSPMNHLAFPILALASVAQAASIPTGTELNVRLTSDVSSNTPSGQRVTAVLTTPVFVNGTPVISAGTQLMGNTADTRPYKPAADGGAEQQAALRVHFTKIEDPKGQSKSISCVLKDVDNARETVDPSGLITGIRQSETFAAQIDRGINKLQSRYAQFAQILTGVKGAMLNQVDSSIDYKAGTDLKLEIIRAFDWNAPASASSVGPITPAAELDAAVNSQPFRTMALNPPDPSDMTNLMFIGTAEQVQAAFQSAGWFAADALGQNSKMETARAIIENRGYKEAPMSILTLEGKPPDLALQKQTNTFAKRHHIRIWQRPQQFNGKPIWVAAATHDISITFSPTAKNFTHGIDPNIDAERSKVVNDLLFTGTVHGVALVERSKIPQNASNATGDKLLTDGKMAVLEF